MQAAEAKVAAAKSAFEQARKKQDETKDEYERAAFTNQQSPAVEKVCAPLLDCPLLRL